MTQADLQAEIDRLAAQGGGTVTIPAGVHTIDAPLRLPPNVRVEGTTGDIARPELVRRDVCPTCGKPGDFATFVGPAVEAIVWEEANVRDAEERARRRSERGPRGRKQ